MLEPTVVSIREVSRNQRKIFGVVMRTKNPVLVLNQKIPQVAIVSLEDLEELKKIKAKKSIQNLWDLVKKAEKIPEDKNIPRDVSINHDYYAWGGRRKTI